MPMRFARLREIVAELPPRTREIFRLNRLEGLTHAEVARRRKSPIARCRSTQPAPWPM